MHRDHAIWERLGESLPMGDWLVKVLGHRGQGYVFHSRHKSEMEAKTEVARLNNLYEVARLNNLYGV